MIAVVTSRTRDLYLRRPTPPYVFNKDCSQAQGLQAFWPLGEPSALMYHDYVRTKGSYKLTQNGTMAIAPGPFSDGLATSNTGSTSNWLQIASAVVTDYPATMACWVYPLDVTTYRNCLVVSQEASAGDYMTLDLGGDIGGDPVVADVNEVGFATTTTGYVANQWQHICGVYTSTSLVAAYLNGGGKGTDTSSGTPNGWNTTVVGAGRFSSTTFSPINGRLAHACIWNRTLTDDEVFELYEPPTRWQLYYPVGTRKYFKAPAAAGGVSVPALARASRHFIGVGIH